MTGYTVHSGTTIQFSEGWDRIFETHAKTRKPTKAAKNQMPSTTVKVATKKAKNAQTTSRKQGRTKGK